jgi:hypothetical protein
MGSITGQGIARPTRSPLPSTTASGWCRPLDDALADYQLQRDGAVLPTSEFTTDLASFPTPRIEEEG